MTIIFSEPGRGFKNIEDRLLKSFKKVIRSDSYILGKNVEIFENKITNFLNPKGHFVSCASGTDAITLAILSLDIKAGSKVLVPSHTAPASIIGIRNAKCIPVYVDIEKDTPLISIDEIINAINKTKIDAILIVHLYGMGVNVNKLKKLINNRDIKIIEDCSQSFGTKIHGHQSGTIGNSGTFSFFPTKNLSTLGDGGGIWVPTKKLKLRLLKLRQYGWDNKRIVRINNGINSRLDEIHAAFLIESLKSYKKKLILKNKIASFYQRNLNSYFSFFKKDNGIINSYHLLVVKVNHRKELILYMKKFGIILGIHYKVPCHKNGLLSEYKRFKLSNTNQISNKIVSLPIFSELDMKDLKFIVNKLNSFGEKKFKND